MKITFIMPSNVLNGGNRVIGIIAGQLVARGHDVRVITQPIPSISLRRRLRSLTRYRKWLRKVKEGPFLEAIQDRVTTLETRRPVLETDVQDGDVVVATWWETAAWVNALPARKGAKVYFMQDYGARGQEFDKLIPTWRMPFAFITLNSQLKTLIRDQNPNAPVTIMKNAVDQALFQGPARPRGIPPRVGVMHRAQPTKGMDVAAKALRQIRASVPDLRAVAVGSDKGALPDWVELVQSPDDQALADVYRSCDLWLFPSRMEGFGLPIIEAMASHTPVVSTRVGGAADVIEDGISGRLVAIDDPAALAAAAIELLTGPEQTWRLMSKAAYEAVAHYTWSDAVNIFENALYAACKE